MISNLQSSQAMTAHAVLMTTQQQCIEACSDSSMKHLMTHQSAGLLDSHLSTIFSLNEHLMQLALPKIGL